MSYQTFDRLIQLTDIVIWPIVVSALLFIHREQLAGLIEKINSAKLPGGVEVGFDRAALATERRAKEIEASEGGPRLELSNPDVLRHLNFKLAQGGLRPLSSNFDSRYYQELLQTDRKLALAAVRIDLEAMLNNISKFHGVSDEKALFSISKVARILMDRGYVTASQYSLFQDILPLANRAVHGEEPSYQGAASVIAAFSTLLDDFAAWTENNLPN